MMMPGAVCAVATVRVPWNVAVFTGRLRTVSLAQLYPDILKVEDDD